VFTTRALEADADAGLAAGTFERGHGVVYGAQRVAHARARPRGHVELIGREHVRGARSKRRRSRPRAARASGSSAGRPQGVDADAVAAFEGEPCRRGVGAGDRRVALGLEYAHVGVGQRRGRDRARLELLGDGVARAQR
jgi:hypothetical protein